MVRAVPIPSNQRDLLVGYGAQARTFALVRHVLRILPTFAYLGGHRPHNGRLFAFRTAISVLVAGAYEDPEALDAVRRLQGYQIEDFDHHASYPKPELWAFGVSYTAGRQLLGWEVAEVSFIDAVSYAGMAIFAESSQLFYEDLLDARISEGEFHRQVVDSEIWASTLSEISRDLSRFKASEREIHYLKLELWVSRDGWSIARRWINELKGQDGPWTFWAEWYRRVLEGDPLPWNLQKKIALIPNEIWEAGPEAVAEEIARIEAAYELRQSIAEVEADQSLIEERRLGIGGNNPPEEIDDPETAQQVVILWESIAGLKEEVEADEPDAERVAALIESLAAALKTVIAWCGRKGDLIVDTTIKTTIGWALPAASGGYFFLNPAKAEAVLKAAQSWLPFLAP